MVVVRQVHLRAQRPGTGVEGPGRTDHPPLDRAARLLAQPDPDGLARADARGGGLGHVDEDAEGVGLADREQARHGRAAAGGDEGAAVHGPGRHRAAEGSDDALIVLLGGEPLDGGLGRLDRRLPGAEGTHPTWPPHGLGRRDARPTSASGTASSNPHASSPSPRPTPA